MPSFWIGLTLIKYLAVDQADWLILFPGFAIVLTVLSLQVAGDGLRDALDPKLQKVT